MQWLAGFGLLVLGLFGFASIADEVMEGETHALDLQILKALRTPNDLSDPIGPPWLEASVSDNELAVDQGLCQAAVQISPSNYTEVICNRS